MTKNISKFRKKFATTLMLFITFLTLFTGKHVHAFNPEEYHKDDNKKHIHLGWRYETGSFLDNNKRDFYSLSEITPFVPCIAHKEWLNEKQAAKNAVGSVPFLGAALDITDIAGLNDKFINDTEMKIANLNDVAQLNLVYEPEKGIFYFDENELYKIKEVNVTFCKCDQFSFTLNNVLDTITFPEALRNKEFPEVDGNKVFKETSKSSLTLGKVVAKDFAKERFKNYLQNKSQKKLQSAGNKAATKAAKKTGGKVLGFFGKFAVPGLRIGNDYRMKKNDDSENIKELITFNVYNDYYKKSVGFAIEFPSENVVQIHHFFKDENGNQKYETYTRNIEESSHFLVDVVRNKKFNPVSLYQGKKN